MNYRYMDLKIDQFVNYVNEGKINLIPPFQRDHVWRLPDRKKLLENIVLGRPIPAIFLYREASGETYSYNILDGKQRLESLILFIGDERPSLKIAAVKNFFHSKSLTAQANFKISVNGAAQTVKDLDDESFRNFREYVIPTIEITLNDDHTASLDEIIDLFVDINSTGIAVKRFSVVKALFREHPLLKGVFGLIAEKQTRKRDVFYRAKDNDFTWVLKRLQIVSKIQEANSKVDRMWELLVELVLFLRTKKHRTPIEILKSFLKGKTDDQFDKRISKPEEASLRHVFRFLRAAYRNDSLADTRLVANQIHFYTMITAIMGDSMLDRYSQTALTEKLAKFGAYVDGESAPPGRLRKTLREYLDLSAKHTTHPGRREDRQRLFVDAIEAI